MNALMRPLLLGVVALLTGTAAVAAGPPMPYEDPGACPFECCTYREWDVVKEVAVHRSRSEKSPVSYRLAAMDKVTALTGVVVTTRPGVVTVAKAAKMNFTVKTPSGPQGLTVPAGGRFYLLHYLGEGYFKIWYEGHVFSQEVFDPDPDGVFHTQSRPQDQWWAQLRNAKGQVGWAQVNGAFTNIDGCG